MTLAVRPNVRAFSVNTRNLVFCLLIVAGPRMYANRTMSGTRTPALSGETDSADNLRATL